MEWFFRHFMHNYSMNSSIFTKLGDFALKYQYFTKFSVPATPKMCHLTQLFPKISESSHISVPSAPKNVLLNSQSHPSPFVWSSPIRSLISTLILDYSPS